MEETPLASEPQLKSMPRSFEQWQVGYLRVTNQIIIWAMLVAFVVITGILFTRFKDQYWELGTLDLLLLSASYLTFVAVLDFIFGLPSFLEHYLSKPIQEPMELLRKSFSELSTELVFTFILLYWYRTRVLCFIILCIGIIFWMIAPTDNDVTPFLISVLIIAFLLWFLILCTGIFASAFPAFPWPSVIIFFCWIISCLVIIYFSLFGGLVFWLGELYMMWKGGIGLNRLFDTDWRSTGFYYIKPFIFDFDRAILTIVPLLSVFLIIITFSLGMLFLERRLKKVITFA
jgi:hypothetical protein